MTEKTHLAALADEIVELDSETFGVPDRSDAAEVVLAGSTCCSSASACSGTTSTTSRGV